MASPAELECDHRSRYSFLDQLLLVVAYSSSLPWPCCNHLNQSTFAEKKEEEEEK